MNSASVRVSSFGQSPPTQSTAQDVSNTQISSHSSPDTPGKKERNSRKQCPYCHKVPQHIPPP